MKNNRVVLFLPPARILQSGLAVFLYGLLEWVIRVIRNAINQE
jgi:hypothetical protein